MSLAPTIWCDNTITLSLASNLVFHVRTKHIEVDYHFLHKCVVHGDFSLDFISTDDQTANLLKKALASPRFILLRGKLLLPHPQHLFEGDESLHVTIVSTHVIS